MGVLKTSSTPKTPQPTPKKRKSLGVTPKAKTPKAMPTPKIKLETPERTPETPKSLKKKKQGKNTPKPEIKTEISSPKIKLETPKETPGTPKSLKKKKGQQKNTPKLELKTEISTPKIKLETPEGTPETPNSSKRRQRQRKNTPKLEIKTESSVSESPQPTTLTRKTSKPPAGSPGSGKKRKLSESNDTGTENGKSPKLQSFPGTKSLEDAAEKKSSAKKQKKSGKKRAQVNPILKNAPVGEKAINNRNRLKLKQKIRKTKLKLHKIDDPNSKIKIILETKLEKLLQLKANMAQQSEQKSGKILIPNKPAASKRQKKKAKKNVQANAAKKGTVAKVTPTKTKKTDATKKDNYTSNKRLRSKNDTAKLSKTIKQKVKIENKTDSYVLSNTSKSIKRKSSHEENDSSDDSNYEVEKTITANKLTKTLKYDLDKADDEIMKKSFSVNKENLSSEGEASENSSSAGDSTDDEDNSDYEVEKTVKAEKVTKSLKYDPDEADADITQTPIEKSIKIEKKKISKKEKREKIQKTADKNLASLKKEDIIGKGKSRYVVFVGNIPYSADKNSLSNHFASAGEVVSVRIPKDKKNNKPRGFGYVEFKDANSFERALSKHQTVLDGRRINVLYTMGGNKNSEGKKKEIRNKNLKLQAMRQSGMLIGSKKVYNKRSARRAKAHKSKKSAENSQE